MKYPHSGAQPVSGAAAELRHRLHGTRESVSTRPVGAPVPPLAGHLSRVILDTVTTLAGIAVFGAVALFFLILI